jgi:hypothetical protein
MNLNRMYLQCIHEFHHICVIYQCTTAFMFQLIILGTCIHVEGSQMPVTSFPLNQWILYWNTSTWVKHPFTFMLSREVANDRRDWNAPTHRSMYQGKEESGIWFPRWPYSQSSSLQNKPKKTLTLYQNWDCGKKMIQQKTVKFMVSYMCLCIKLQSNPKSLCEDSFRTQLKTRESLCTSSKSNASSINGNYATATWFTLLPSAAAITNIDQKVSWKPL